MTELTLTELRKNLFRYIDDAARTGEPIRVRRKGRVVNFRVEELAPEPAHRDPVRANFDFGENGEVPAWLQERRRAYLAAGPRGWITDADFTAIEKALGVD